MSEDKTALTTDWTSWLTQVNERSHGIGGRDTFVRLFPKEMKDAWEFFRSGHIELGMRLTDKGRKFLKMRAAGDQTPEASSLTQRVVDRVKQAGGYPGAAQWNSDEERALSRISSYAYGTADEVNDDLRKKLAELERLVGNDREKKSWVKSCRELVDKAKAALNQIGYTARNTYDVRWASEQDSDED